jgi:hypothetical protein
LSLELPLPLECQGPGGIDLGDAPSLGGVDGPHGKVARCCRSFFGRFWKGVHATLH